MRCGEETLQDCVVAHIAPVFPLACETPGRQWSHGRCPSCRHPDSLSLGIKDGRSLLWTCHRTPTGAHPEPPCTYEAILTAAASKRPDCISTTRRPRRTVDVEELAELLDLDDRAMRLRLACLAWQVTPREAAKKLGMSRATYYRAVSDVRRNRRSA